MKDQVTVSEFRANCLKLIDKVYKSRKPLLITRRGKFVANLVPAGNPRDDFFGQLEGVMEIAGDIEAPVIPIEDWEVLK
jgi:prevent-host-death family protein